MYDKDAVYIDLGGSHASRGAEVRVKAFDVILGNAEQKLLSAYSCSILKKSVLTVLVDLWKTGKIK